MSFAKKTITLVIGLAMIGGTIGAAAAETPWQRDHPWREEVNDRLALKIGASMPNCARARSLPGEPASCREDAPYSHEERAMAGFDQRPSDPRRAPRAQSAGERGEPRDRPLSALLRRESFGARRRGSPPRLNVRRCYSRFLLGG